MYCSFVKPDDGDIIIWSRFDAIIWPARPLANIDLLGSLSFQTQFHPEKLHHNQ